MNPAALIEWLGDGGTPVKGMEADARAQICLRCPQHRPEKIWETLATHPVAITIRKWLSAKAEWKLETRWDDQLGVCNVCRCAAALKVFTPLKHILAHAPPREAYDKDCWIRSEKP